MAMTTEAIEQALGTDRWIYIAIGPNVWGKGFTIEQALHAVGPLAKAQHIVYAVADPWASIDDVGNICYMPRERMHRDEVEQPRHEYIEVARKERTARRGNR